MSNTNVDYALIGRRIRYYRTLRNITQSMLAEDIGVADNYISMIETGYKKASLEVLVSICNVLDITMDILLRDNLKPKFPDTKSLIEELFSDCTEEETMFVIDAMSSIVDTLHCNRYVLKRVDM